jgi:hypothetical protein
VSGDWTRARDVAGAKASRPYRPGSLAQPSSRAARVDGRVHGAKAAAHTNDLTDWSQKRLDPKAIAREVCMAFYLQEEYREEPRENEKKAQGEVSSTGRCLRTLVIRGHGNATEVPGAVRRRNKGAARLRLEKHVRTGRPLRNLIRAAGWEKRSNSDHPKTGTHTAVDFSGVGHYDGCRRPLSAVPPCIRTSLKFRSGSAPSF